MNAERLNEIRKRWAVRWSVGDDKWIWEDHHEADKAIAKVVSPEHAAAIAAAPTDIADLLAEVERLRAEVVQLNEAVEHRRRGEAAAAAEVDALRETLWRVFAEVAQWDCSECGLLYSVGLDTARRSWEEREEVDCDCDSLRGLLDGVRAVIGAGEPAGGDS